MTVTALDTPAALLERIRLVPDELREFSVSPTGAREGYGVRPQLLDELLDLGLPVRGAADAPHMDARDLANIALHLGLASIQRRAIVGWRQTLLATSRATTTSYRLTYCAACPRPGHDVPCDISLTLPEQSIVERHDRGAAVVTLSRPVRWPELPAAAVAAAETLADLQFFALPPALHDDVGFTRRTRLAGCRMAARLIAEECRSAGVIAVIRAGLLLSTPFSTRHSWVEIPAGGTAVPFDPHLIRMMVRHGGLNAEEWPVVRSPGAILAPFGHGDLEPAYHAGEPIEPSVYTHLEVA